MRTVLVVIVFGWSAIASAADENRVVLARGNVTVRSNDGARDAVIGMTLAEGDQIRTGRDSSVRLLLASSAVVDLSENTSMVVTRASSTQKTSIKIWSGRLWARVTKMFGSSEFEVEGPNAVAGVRGTEFVVEVASDGSTDINVLDGSVAVQNRMGGPIQMLGVGERIGAQTGREMTASKSSDGDRRTLRSAASAGLRLGAAGAASRFGAMQPHLTGGGGQRAPKIGDRLPVPPLDIDPAAGRIQLRGTLNVQE